jgi:hypothetical protein
LEEQLTTKQIDNMENIVYTNEQLALKLAVDGRNTSARNSTAALEVADKYLKWLNENKTK